MWVEAGVIDWADRNEKWGLPSDIDGQYALKERYGVGVTIHHNDGSQTLFETPMSRKMTSEAASALAYKIECDDCKPKE